MKTFTVTFHHTTNYGAVLQAYSLHKTIKRLGHENVVMEYPGRTRFYNRPFKRLSKTARSLYVNWLRFLRKKQLMSLQQSFVDFRRNRMELSREYADVDALRNDPPVADCLITGSDQVWKLSGKQEQIAARFLDFGGENVKRISYAASIEQLNYTPEQREQVKTWLSRFDGISLREQGAAEYIAELTGRQDVLRVMDPVFLQTKAQWLEIAAKPRLKGPFILCYQVQSNPRMQEVADKLKKQTGYPVVSICNTEIRHIKADHHFHDVSPEEFLGLYNEASIVVSASFHGTAFGLLFGKPTYGLIRSTHANRIREILTLFGLEQFCIGMTEAIPEPQIDENALEEAISRERVASLAYLQQHLKDKHSEN